MIDWLIDWLISPIKAFVLPYFSPISYPPYSNWLSGVPQGRRTSFSPPYRKAIRRWVAGARPVEEGRLGAEGGADHRPCPVVVEEVEVRQRAREAVEAAADRQEVASHPSWAGEAAGVEAARRSRTFPAGAVLERPVRFLPGTAEKSSNIINNEKLRKKNRYLTVKSQFRFELLHFGGELGVFRLGLLLGRDGLLDFLRQLLARTKLLRFDPVHHVL